MFTMDDWLGLVLLMVCIVSAIALIVMFVVGCVGVVRWWLSEHWDAFGTQRAGRSAPPFRSVPSEADFAAARVMSDAIGRSPLVLHTHDSSKPLSREEICKLLQVDPSIGYYNFGADIGRVRDQVVQSLGVPAWMLRGDPPPAGPLATIVDDLRAAIDGEHLEIRTRNRFAAILNRLENYRDS